jgi:hypothetical protein
MLPDPFSVNFGISWAEFVQLYGRFSLLTSSLTFLLKRSQSQSKPFLHENDELVLAHILVQIPPKEFQNLHEGAVTSSYLLSAFMRNSPFRGMGKPGPFDSKLTQKVRAAGTAERTGIVLFLRTPRSLKNVCSSLCNCPIPLRASGTRRREALLTSSCLQSLTNDVLVGVLLPSLLEGIAVTGWFSP